MRGPNGIMKSPKARSFVLFSCYAFLKTPSYTIESEESSSGLCRAYHVIIWYWSFVKASMNGANQ